MSYIKITKLNENKISIALSLEELEKRKIKLIDLKNNTKKAKNLFLNLIKETNLDKTFITCDTELFVEASTNKNNKLVVTITKLNNFKGLDSYNLLENFCNNIQNTNIFVFNTFDNLTNFINCIKTYNGFIGKNSLYIHNDSYILLFSKYSISNYNFCNLNNFLSEYSDKSFISTSFENILKEHGTEIILNKAIQTLISIF